MMEVYVAAPDDVPRVHPRLFMSGRQLNGRWYLADDQHEEDFVKVSKRANTVFFVGKQRPLLLTKQKPDAFSVFFQIPDDDRPHRAWVEPLGRIGMRWCRFESVRQPDGTVGFLARGTILGNAQAIGSPPTAQTMTPAVFQIYVKNIISNAAKNDGLKGLARSVLSGVGVVGFTRFMAFVMNQPGTLPEKIKAATKAAYDIILELSGIPPQERNEQPGPSGVFAFPLDRNQGEQRIEQALAPPDGTEVTAEQAGGLDGNPEASELPNLPSLLDADGATSSATLP